MTRLLFALMCAIAWWAPAASAQDKSSPATPPAKEIQTIICPLCHRANSDDTPYPERASRSLVRGATNAMFGWTELLARPAHEVQGGHTPRNVLSGIGKGVGYAFRRTAMGFGEIFTFWSPRGDLGYSQVVIDCPICMKVRPESSGPSPKGEGR